MQIIGITGKARAGKDTIGAWLRDNKGAYTTSFAWPIKKAVCEMFAIPFDVFNDERKELEVEGLGVSPRVLAQTLGTEWGRATVGNDVWIRSLERRLLAAKVYRQDPRPWEGSGGLVVVTDVRFENEAAWVRERGTLIHVVRPGADGAVGVAGHASEQGVQMMPGDIFISNNEGLPELHWKLAQIFGHVAVAA